MSDPVYPQLDAIPDEIVARMVDSPMMDELFSWVRRSGPDPTKEEVALALLAAAMAVPEPCALCFGTGEMLVKTSIVESDRTETCSECGGSGLSDVRVALVRQVGWHNKYDGLVPIEWTASPEWTRKAEVVPVYVDVLALPEVPEPTKEER